jgi:hypothetical protein
MPLIAAPASPDTKESFNTLPPLSKLVEASVEVATVEEHSA